MVYASVIDLNLSCGWTFSRRSTHRFFDNMRHIAYSSVNSYVAVGKESSFEVTQR